MCLLGLPDLLSFFGRSGISVEDLGLAVLLPFLHYESSRSTSSLHCFEDPCLLLNGLWWCWVSPNDVNAWPQLGSSSFFIQEPELLRVDADRIQRQMQEVAVGHYRAFIAAADAVQHISHEITSVDQHLKSLVMKTVCFLELLTDWHNDMCFDWYAMMIHTFYSLRLIRSSLSLNSLLVERHFKLQGHGEVLWIFFVKVFLFCVVDWYEGLFLHAVLWCTIVLLIGLIASSLRLQRYLSSQVDAMTS